MNPHIPTRQTLTEPTKTCHAHGHAGPVVGCAPPTPAGRKRVRQLITALSVPTLADSSMKARGYQRRNGRWEARYRPTSSFPLPTLEAHGFVFRCVRMQNTPRTESAMSFDRAEQRQRGCASRNAALIAPLLPPCTPLYTHRPLPQPT